MKFIGKIKGRGYWCGIESKNIATRKPQSLIDAETKRYMSSPQGRIPYWYDENDYHREPRSVCKRNASDVPAPYIFNSKEEFAQKLVDETSYEEANDALIATKEVANVVLEEFKEDTVQKRVLNSKKKTEHVKSIMSITTRGASFCGSCGTNIYDDEPRMMSPYVTICIHCLKPLGLTIADLYDAVPEKYKDDYLLARSVDI